MTKELPSFLNYKKVKLGIVNPIHNQGSQQHHPRTENNSPRSKVSGGAGTASVSGSLISGINEQRMLKNNTTVTVGS